jgi:hypothetical protein
MEQHRKRTIVPQVAAGVLAIAYAGVLYSQHSITDTNQLDGIIGAMLGLFICAGTAANLIDALYDPGARKRGAWLAANFLVLMWGLFIIIVGTTRFADSRSMPPIIH